MKAIGVTCGVGSLLIGARAAGFEVEGNVEWRKYYSEPDQQGRTTFGENFPGAIYKYNMEQMTEEEFARFSNADIALGHPESHPDIPIYTSRGWRMTSELQKGDLVLTHRGRFKKIHDIYKRRPGPDTEKITLSRNSRKSRQSIVLAGNHPVLMSDGTWRKAREVRKGEEITYLCDVCPRCGELAPIAVNRTGVSCSCAPRDHWGSLTRSERQRMVEAAHAATAQKIEQGTHDFLSTSVRKKGQEVQARRSEAEDVIASVLEDVELERQYAVSPYFVDLAIPRLKIAVEVDGGRWHGMPEKQRQDQEKTRYLESLGWQVVRVEVRVQRLGSIATTQKIQECVEEVRRLSMNHDGQYRFATFKVGGLWREEFDPEEQLYDLSIEDDNSYVGQSVILHNCGNFSQLSGANSNRMEKLFDPADIPLFVEIIAKLKPRYFVMDDLPKSFMAYPMAKYAEKLPDYDLFPEWISNYHYGNVQKGRKRMFMLGALRTEGWAFRPGEFDHAMTVADVIGDLGEPRRGSNMPNHDPHAENEDCFRALNLGGFRKHNMWGDVKKYFSDKGGGFTLAYPRADGSVVKRIGFLKGHWDGPSHVLTGGNAVVHNKRCDPYTIRERARIQGFPDDFVFYGTVLNEDGEWNHELNPHMVKQTGKAMPVQFATYVSKQIAAHIEGQPFESTGLRLLDNNEYVDEAKYWYCGEGPGYSEQAKACGECWLFKKCTIRLEKYGILDAAGATVVAARQQSTPPAVQSTPEAPAPEPVAAPPVPPAAATPAPSGARKKRTRTPGKDGKRRTND